MKFCQICERNYRDEVHACETDGATLKLMDASEDAYLGKVIKGRYKVIRKLGEGGMGSVYLAEQIAIGRKVALKVLKGSFSTDDEFIGRFRREARSAASLNHPHVVTVYDFDQGNDGRLFIAMEYLPGCKLGDVIRRDGPLSIDRAVRIGLQIAEGLQAAHRAGVIHRDIKPDNIMIMGERGFDNIKLLDFGIARLQDSATAVNLTRTGVIMGTPSYMAPEQAEGAQVSEKTDIYALGIVLYELLSGSVPFKAATPNAVLFKQLHEAPTPLRKVRKEVPAAVEQLVMRSLEKSPEKRPRDMTQVIEHLRGIGLMVTPAKASSPGGPGIAVIRNKIHPKLIAAAFLIFFVAAFSAYWHFGTGKISEENRIASIQILGDKKELQINEKLRLRVSAAMVDGTEVAANNQFEWISSDDSIAEVNASGEVLGRKFGNANISVRYRGLESPVFSLVVKQSPEVSRQLEELTKKAVSHRDGGEYENALAALKAAQKLAPSNETLVREIQTTMNACLTEKKMGLTKETCTTR